ncbi:MAG: exodeoxyribonuclease VII small subunit [Firmicutes bacterium]|nr:exodeoxyribonuclease VII small subunit [Bacillota bacterium]
MTDRAERIQAEGKELSQVERLSFEEALHRLEEVLDRLESSDIPLEEALALFEEGQALAGYCQRKLDEAEKRIEILTAGENGEVLTKRWSPGKGDDQT